MIRKINIVFFLAVLILSSCKDEFWPELGEYENIIVVDGAITNEPGPYEVRLSVSTSVQNPEFIPITSAQVQIIDNEGVSENLTEISPGHYQTSENGMQGIVGNAYKVLIVNKEKTYESDFQTIENPVGIKQIYAETEDRPTENEFYPLYGYQFYLDTETAESDTTFFLWRMYGTYKYQSDFLIRYTWDGRLKPFPQPDSLFTCYNDDNIDIFLTMSTAGLTTPVITGLPLNFVNTETRKLSIRYSLLVKQYSLNREAFAYFDGIRGVRSEQGSLYTEQPYQVRGNVFNTANQNELVLGYFLVGGVSEKRIYVDRPSQVDFHYSECELTRRDFEAYGFISWTDPVSWPLFVTTSPNGARALPPQGCMDCREQGGEPVVPDFWED